MKDGGKKFSDDECIDHFWKGSSKTRIQYCKHSCHDLLYVRAVQGHTGGEVMAPELMGQVTVPFNGKELIFHRGFALNSKSISGAGLVAGEKESKEERQTVFSSLTDSPGRLRLKNSLKATCQSQEK